MGLNRLRGHQAHSGADTHFHPQAQPHDTPSFQLAVQA
jgi:hypothetical protein